MKNDEASLREFLSAYFHEDWLTDASSADEVVTQYLRDQPSPNEMAHVARTLRDLLASGANDEQLSAKLFSEFGCYFDPRGLGQSTRAWLESLSQRIREQLGERGEI